MNAEKLYEKLEKDFIKPGLSDEWAKYMDEIKDFLSENFKKRSMGLVCDNSNEIKKVYTAVFPTKEVMKTVLKKGKKDALLFVHHPSIWDITKKPVFYQMDRELLKKFKENRISIYNLHVPLDNFGEYSTGTSLAKVLKINVEKPFAPYYGGYSGLIGSTSLRTADELAKKFKEAVGHKISLYKYGENKIKNGKVAIVAGGGNSPDTLRNIAKRKINVFITGISAKNEHSREAHDCAKRYKISIIGGTHYSTEKFACMAMCNYFKKLGLKSEFIEGKPGIEDL